MHSLPLFFFFLICKPKWQRPPYECSVQTHLKTGGKKNRERFVSKPVENICCYKEALLNTSNTQHSE